MFQEWYKQANDDIPVNGLLKEQLKRKAQQPQKPVLYKKIYPLGAAVAGVLLVAVTLRVYPLFSEVQQPSDVDVDPAVFIQNATVAPIAPVTPDPASAPPAVVQTEQPIAAAGQPAKTQRPAAPRPEPRKEQPAAAAKATPQATKKPVKTEAPSFTEPPAQTAAVQTEQPVFAGEPQVKGVDSAPEVSLETVTWTRQDYNAYLGLDVDKALQLPEEFSDIGAVQKTMSVYTDTKQPYYDLWSFKYAAEDGRRVTVKTKKINAAPVETPNMQLCGTDVQVVNTEQEYIAEFFYKDIYFTVQATGLAEQEFIALCTALLSA